MKNTNLKKEARVVGIDDGPFDKFKDKNALIVGTIYRGGEFLDGIVSSKIRIDGVNSTSKIIEMINNCKWKKSLQCIFLDGIAVGGFNVIDVERLFNKTKIPVIVVMRNYPDLEKMFNALKKIKMENKISLIKKAGRVYRYKKIHFQFIGIDKNKAEDFLKLTIKNAEIPEPLRIAHIIASGIVKGESYGKS